MRAKAKSSGFTLIEVMVALLVVAVSISALLTQVMTTVDSTVRLREKTLASWVALNQLELLYISNGNPASPTFNQLITSEQTGTEQMAGLEWHWKIKPLQGTNTGSVPVEVLVSLSPDEGEDPIVRVVGVIDTFRRVQ